MMISSADWQTEVARCRELGIPRHLTKPAKKSELIKAVLACRGSVSAKWRSGSSWFYRHGYSDPTRRSSSLRLLLADDNEFNRRVGLMKLEKRATPSGSSAAVKRRSTLWNSRHSIWCSWTCRCPTWTAWR